MIKHIKSRRIKREEVALARQEKEQEEVTKESRRRRKSKWEKMPLDTGYKPKRS